MRYLQKTIEPAQKIMLCLLMILFCGNKSSAQETVINLFKSDLKTADEYYQQKNYHSALPLYSEIEKRKKSPRAIRLKLARTHFFLKDYTMSAHFYEKAFELSETLQKQDNYYYAEALNSLGQYEHAEHYYQAYLVEYPTERELIMNKIWRLNNVHYLMEDSIHFAIRKLPIDSIHGGFGLREYASGLVFISNKERIGWVKKLDASTDKSFYQLQQVNSIEDTLQLNSDKYTPPEIFSKSLGSSHHMGTFAFYSQEQRMVFSRSEQKKGDSDSYQLHLHFAQKIDNKWVQVSSFAFNSTTFSNSDPAINEEGTRLFFSSDRPGGYGGKDIYQCEYTEGKWTEPVNLGETINTSKDEVFSFFHNNSTLYFSSNGHPGLGGLDIFKVEFNKGKWKNLENLGYPLNSGHDDFGISVAFNGKSGYFSSNRLHPRHRDDMYAFEADVQSYPVKVEGIVQYIEDNWMDSTNLKVLAKVDLYLIDDAIGEVVSQAITDDEGRFQVSIPYLSRYTVKIKSEDLEGIIPFEVPKYAKLQGAYHIVVVKDDFKVIANNLKE